MNPNILVVFDYSVNHIARNFKAVRLAFGCSLEEIAATLGCTRQTISKYENPEYKWKPYDYFALRCMFELLAFSIQDTNYYLEIWNRLIEGMTYEDGICVNEAYIDRLAKRILELGEARCKKYDLVNLSFKIQKTLIEEGYFELKNEDKMVLPKIDLSFKIQKELIE